MLVKKEGDKDFGHGRARDDQGRGHWAFLFFAAKSRIAQGLLGR